MKTATPLIKTWNLDFTLYRRENTRRFLRYQLRCSPKGRGNEAWRRVENMNRPEPGTILWPDYALPMAKDLRTYRNTLEKNLNHFDQKISLILPR